MSIDLKKDSVTVVVIHPGWVKVRFLVIFVVAILLGIQIGCSNFVKLIY